MAAAERVLHQFRFSHYNEKARWALDYKGLAHRRESYIPGPHRGALRRVSGQPQVPVLCEAGQAIAGSAAIVDHLERTCPTPALYPADAAERQRALALQAWFDDEVGGPIRAAAFHEWLEDGALMTTLYAAWKGPLAATAYRAGFPLLRQAMRAAMHITPEVAAQGVARAGEAFERVAREAGPDGYLVGNRFTIADLAAAAILSPAVLPDEFPYPPPRPHPPTLARWLARWREHPGAAWVREMYRRHRGRYAGDATT